jgi:cellulose synthase/poly-beta-1,6-N-acetylglucosamine synthase-like glycosyltransferase
MNLDHDPISDQSAAASRPLLSITMPTKDRPQLLSRALASVGRGVVGPEAEQVELTVSDGSADDASAQVVQQFLTGWAGRHRYVHNRPPLPLVDNMNRAIELASGDWVMQLDDDDYLLPGAVAAMVKAIESVRPEEAVLLFGVDIVNGDGARSRTQGFRHQQYLEPAQAMERLLRNSSFVREPAVVVRRAALEREGLFDPSVGGATDTDMWVKLFSRYGVRCFPTTTCAYTIHQAAATTGMWNPDVVASIGEIFDRAVATGVVPEEAVRRWETDFMHQFILAGAFRRLRVLRRTEAGQVLQLFELPEVRALGGSRKWWPVRAAFTAATAGAHSSPAQ